MVEKVKGPPDIDILGEFADGQADDVLGIGPIAKEIDAAAEGLEHGLRHLLAQQFQLEKGIDLFAQHIDMDRGAAGDLQGKIAGGLPALGRHQIGVQQDAVLIIRLGKVAGRVGDVIAVGLAQGFEGGGSSGIMGDSSHIGIRGCVVRGTGSCENPGPVYLAYLFSPR